MKQDRATKRQIIEDWNGKFPMLRKYSENSIFMRMDCFLVGISFDTSQFNPDSYWPCFEIRGLWHDNISKNGLLFEPLNIITHIDYSKHRERFEESCNLAKGQFAFMFHETVQLSDFFNCLKILNRIRRGRITLYERSTIIETICAVATLFDNDKELKKEIIEKAVQETKCWNEDHFKQLYHKSVEDWRNQLFAYFFDDKNMVEIVKANFLMPKIERLKVGHIINDGKTAREVLMRPDYPLKNKFLDWLNSFLYN